MTTSPDASGPTATTARAMLPAAAARFGALVHRVPVDGWHRPTPCADWSVRDLVNHLVGEHLWVPPLLGGGTLADVGDRFDGDVLGDAPGPAWDAAVTASLKAWAMAREDQKVDLSAGPTQAGEYAEQMLLDLVVHAWDLARAIDVDAGIVAGIDASVDEEQAAHVLAYVEPHAAEWAAAGVFAEPVRTSRADALSRLVALSGRDPEWTPSPERA
jgi:uncharacterized protein (TIGR03086 family)